jgi:predicted GIY-YIG superfamily endonuclease
VHYVYLLESQSHPGQHYTGLTDDLRARLAQHNAAQVTHTSKFRPWRLVTYLAFSTRAQAAQFERYLKSGSGRAFAHRRSAFRSSAATSSDRLLLDRIARQQSPSPLHWRRWHDTHSSSLWTKGDTLTSR